MSDNAAPAAPATGQPSSASINGDLQNIVGTRSLDGKEQAALLSRLEANGTTLDQVNEIARKNGAPEYQEDSRSDAERKFDQRFAGHDTPDGYLPQMNLQSVLDRNAPLAAVAELDQHGAAFAHALELPKATAGETVRQLVKEAVRVASLKPDALAAHVAKSQAVLSKALGGPGQLQEAIKLVASYLDKAGNSDFAKHVDPGLTDPGTFLTILQAAQRASFRASRRS